jgi:hypothetical protein
MSQRPNRPQGDDGEPRVLGVLGSLAEQEKSG